MSYNDGNRNYAVYSNGKWSDTAAQTIIAADNYTIKTKAERQWWINNSNLSIGDNGNLIATLSRKTTRKIKVEN